MKFFLLALLLLTSCMNILIKDTEPAPDPTLNKPKVETAKTPTETPKVEVKKETSRFTDSIKIAVAWDKKTTELSWKNCEAIEIVSRGKVFKTLTFPNGTFTLSHLSDSTFRIKSKGLSLKSFDDVIIKCKKNSDGHLIYNKNRYRGYFIVRAIPNKGIYLINHLDVEDYLKGVVPNEMGKVKDPKYTQALQAQSIVARSYTYANINKYHKLGFNLKASVADQVYRGMSSEFNECTKAVEATRGEIIMYKNKPVVAYYHSTCGGHTSSFQDCWFGPNEIPYLKSRNDYNSKKIKYCKDSFKAHWTVKYPKWEWKKYLRNKYKIDGVTDINITKKSSSGRVHTLVIETKTGNHSFNGDKVRWVFKKGSKILPSAKFKIKEDKTNYYFIGEGYGHGVGMCQFGAMGRSIAGQTDKEILNAYYTNIDFVNIYEKKETPQTVEPTTEEVITPVHSNFVEEDDTKLSEDGLEF